MRRARPARSALRAPGPGAGRLSFRPCPGEESPSIRCGLGSRRGCRRIVLPARPGTELGARSPTYAGRGGDRIGPVRGGALSHPGLRRAGGSDGFWARDAGRGAGDAECPAIGFLVHCGAGIGRTGDRGVRAARSGDSHRSKRRSRPARAWSTPPSTRARRGWPHARKRNSRRRRGRARGRPGALGRRRARLVPDAADPCDLSHRDRRRPDDGGARRGRRLRLRALVRDVQQLSREAARGASRREIVLLRFDREVTFRGRHRRGGAASASNARCTRTASTSAPRIRTRNAMAPSCSSTIRGSDSSAGGTSCRSGTMPGDVSSASKDSTRGRSRAGASRSSRPRGPARAAGCRCTGHGLAAARRAAQTTAHRTSHSRVVPASMPHVRRLGARFGIRRSRPVRGGERAPSVHVTAPAASARIYLHGAHVTASPADGTGAAAVSERAEPLHRGCGDPRRRADRVPWFGARAGDPSAPITASRGSASGGASRSSASAPASPSSFTLRAERRDAVTVALEFRLTYRVHVDATLSLTLDVENRSAAPFTFEEALHTYLVVGDVRQVAVTGSRTRRTSTRPTGCGESSSMPDRSGRPAKPIASFPSRARGVHGRRPVFGRRLIVDKRSSATTVVWNPWTTRPSAWPTWARSMAVDAVRGSRQCHGRCREARAGRATRDATWRSAPSRCEPTSGNERTDERSRHDRGQKNRRLRSRPPSRARSRRSSPRASTSLAGKRAGILDNGKANAGTLMLAVAERSCRSATASPRSSSARSRSPARPRPRCSTPSRSATSRSSGALTEGPARRGVSTAQSCWSSAAFRRR